MTTPTGGQPDPEEVRLQQDEFPPILYMDQMDEGGRSNLLDLYNLLYRKVIEDDLDSLQLNEFAQWTILSMAYRTGSVNVSLFRSMVAVARRRSDDPPAITEACDEACRLFRNPAPMLDAATLNVMRLQAVREREQGAKGGQPEGESPATP